MNDYMRGLLERTSISRVLPRDSPSFAGILRTAEVFLRIFLFPSSVPSVVDLQQKQPLGDVRQPIEGTQEEVPVPNKINSNPIVD
jgi:hypothetical protein